MLYYMLCSRYPQIGGRGGGNAKPYPYVMPYVMSYVMPYVVGRAVVGCCGS